MAEFPALPIFTDAYLADTRHLSAAQHGAYFLLLMTAWRTKKNGLPDDDDLLSRWACMDKRTWLKNKDAVLHFWCKIDGLWHQKRLDDERKRAEHNRDRQVQAGIASALKRKKSRSTRDGTELPTPLQPPFPSPLSSIEDNTPLPPKGGEAQIDARPDLLTPKENLNTPKTKDTKNGKRLIPPDFAPDAAAIRLADEIGVDIDACLAEFLDWCASKRPMYADWQATFRNSLRRASSVGRFSKGGASGRGREPAGVVAAGLRVAARYKKKLEEGL